MKASPKWRDGRVVQVTIQQLPTTGDTKRLQLRTSMVGNNIYDELVYSGIIASFNEF